MGGLLAGFQVTKTSLIYLVIAVYVVLVIEFIGSLSISIIWSKLSFKATHISERLGLLGLIIIGEGVIGLTKTITRTMGKKGPTYHASAQVFCIICILLFMWMLYFDRTPRYRFGTVKQQIYMVLHFPFHLALLGVVEGSQQLAQARYIYDSTAILGTKVWEACVKEHMDGAALAANLTGNIDYFKLNESARGNTSLQLVYEEISVLKNISGVCSPVNVANTTNTLQLLGLPSEFGPYMVRGISSMYQAFDIDLPPEDKLQSSGLIIALRSWVVVYTYWWSAIILLLCCYTGMRVLSDRKGSWFKIYDLPAFLTRGIVIVTAIVLLVVGRVLGDQEHIFVQTYIGSGWILPSGVFMLWIMCLIDRAGTMWRHRREHKHPHSPLPTDDHEQHQRGRQVDNETDSGIRRRGTNAYGYPSHQ